MLFGHQNDANQPDAAASVTPGSDAQNTPLQTPAVNPLAVDPATGVSLPVETTGQIDHQVGQSVLDQPVASTLDVAQSSSVFDAQAAPLPDPSTPFSAAPAATDVPTAPDDTQAPAAYPSPMFTSDDTAAPAPAVQTVDPITSMPATDDLLGLKQQALSQLGPLVSQLDQSPEEKFRTTMMLIQTTDNSTLLKDAYEAAQAITDEKARAQALLDIVNEINYFQQSSTGASNV
jgi:hypothetical protein